MRVALATSRRPQYVDSQLASARRLADEVVFVTHGFDHPESDLIFDSSVPYPEVVNRGLGLAGELAPAVMKVDDHDTYPDNHDPVSVWEPGATVFGIVKAVNCVGELLGEESSLCGGALDASIRFDGSHHQLAPQITGPMILYSSKVTKRFCQSEWSWPNPPRYGTCPCQ